MNAERGFALRLQAWTTGSRLSLLAVTGVAFVVLGILFLGLPLTALLAGVAALGLVLITLSSPTIGMSFVIAAQYVPIIMGGFTFLQVVGAAVSVLCLIWFAIRQRGIVFPNVLLPVLAMTVLTLYSLTYTRDAALTQYAIRKLVFNAIFCLLLVNVVDGYRKLSAPLWVLVGMGLVNSLVAAQQFAFRTSEDFRAKGLLENENQLGEVAAVAFILPFYHFLYADKSWKRLGYLAICGLLSIGIVTSVSRGAILSLGSGMVYVLLRERRYRKHFLVLAVLVLAGLPLLPKYFYHRFSNLGEEVQGTVFLGERSGLSSRGFYNKAGIRIWKAHPWLGVGFGSYGYYFIQPGFNPGLRASHRLPPHNIYVQALAETGVIGFLVLCWWILQCAYNYWIAERKTDDEPLKQIHLRACETLTLMVLVAYFSAGNLVYTHLAMVIAFGAACRRCAENLSDQQPSGIPPAALSQGEEVSESLKRW